MRLRLPKFVIPRLKIGEPLLVTRITITQQPSNISTFLGTPVTFNCTATTNNNINPTYQWQLSLNGSTFNTINGAINSSYSFTPDLGDNNTFYRCIVSAKYATRVISNSATLTVSDKPGKMTIYKLAI